MKRSYIAIALFVFALTLQCKPGPSHDVTGFYKKVQCETDTIPEREGLEISKLEGNNYKATTIWPVDPKTGKKHKMQNNMLMGLYGDQLKAHGSVLGQFSENYTKLYFQPELCHFAR